MLLITDETPYFGCHQYYQLNNATFYDRHLSSDVANIINLQYYILRHLTSAVAYIINLTTIMLHLTNEYCVIFAEFGDISIGSPRSENTSTEMVLKMLRLLT